MVMAKKGGTFSKFNCIQCEVCGENTNSKATTTVGETKCCSNCTNLLKKEVARNERNSSTVNKSDSKW
jgi:formylmethanofuran dehydrogenase subunit E